TITRSPPASDNRLVPRPPPPSASPRLRVQQNKRPSRYPGGSFARKWIASLERRPHTHLDLAGITQGRHRHVAADQILRVEGEDREARARIEPDLLKRVFLVEERPAHRLDLAPLLVEEVEQVEDADLERQRAPADGRERLADAHVEEALPRIAAAVAGHD